MRSGCCARAASGQAAAILHETAEVHHAARQHGVVAARDTRRAELAPQPNSLLTGKNTGNFAESGLSGGFQRPSQRVNSIASSRIPYVTEQGICKAVSGNFSPVTGNFSNQI